jgi:FKBP-type peptidyl-prolyl cis-trans isomerase FkpA
MKKYFLLLLIFAAAMQLKAQDAFQRTTKGTEYRILTHNTGEKIQLNQIITFRMIQKSPKDSVLSDGSHQAQIQPTGDLMDVFPLLTVKDSVLIRVPTDSIFKAHEDARPPFLPKGSNLFVTIKIEKVQTLDEAVAERQKAMAEEHADAEKNNTEEAANINKYIAAHHWLYNTTTSGLKYKITRQSVKRKPLAGDTVQVNYTGRTLDGKVFDSSIEAEAQKAGLQQPGRAYEPLSFVVGSGQVIPGWDEGLLLLNEGAKATFIIPSKLAYGDKGMSEDIKPYSTLRFDVELVKVKPIKHAPVKPAAKKPPVKKHVVAKKKS